jgi:hypothetical protein
VARDKRGHRRGSSAVLGYSRRTETPELRELGKLLREAYEKGGYVYRKPGEPWRIGFYGQNSITR